MNKGKVLEALKTAITELEIDDLDYEVIGHIATSNVGQVQKILSKCDQEANISLVINGQTHYINAIGLDEHGGVILNLSDRDSILKRFMKNMRR